MFATSPHLPKTSTFEWLALTDLRGAPLRLAVSYWSQIRGDRPFPRRDELKARNIAGLLPYFSLVKVIDDGADFEHRIVGDVVVRAFCVPIQNRRFSDIACEAPKLIETSFELFRKVVETRAPLAWRQTTGRDASHVVFTQAEMVLLPLGEDPNAVDHVAGFAMHESGVAPRPAVRVCPRQKA